MDLLTSVAIIVFAALIHASFQLSVSMFTLLSSHAIGRKTSQMRLLDLSASFVLGVMVMTLLVLSFLVLLGLSLWGGADAPLLAYAVASGLAIGVGVAVWAFYFRRRPGTTLWLPASFTRFLTDRIKATRLSPEAFSLGLVSVLAELIFVIAPLVCASLVMIRLGSPYLLVALLGYVLISVAPLVIVVMRVNAGRRLSDIQRWREANKRFLQFIAGSALIALGAYLYVSEVAAVATTVQEALW